MNRKEFLTTCSYGCIAGIIGVSLFQSCGTSNILVKQIIGSNIFVPISDFKTISNGKKEFKKYIIIQNENLKYPICIYRFSTTDYAALQMACTHQGAELQVFGDRLQCSAHGSEFSNRGVVESSPASTDLRKFPIIIEENTLKISLK